LVTMCFRIRSVYSLCALLPTYQQLKTLTALGFHLGTWPVIKEHASFALFQSC
jgi:hypothetical protein